MLAHLVATTTQPQVLTRVLGVVRAEINATCCYRALGQWIYNSSAGQSLAALDQAAASNPLDTPRCWISARSWIWHQPGWLADPAAVLAAVVDELVWEQEEITIYGRRLLQPRLTAVCGRSMDPSSRYRRPRAETPWSPVATAIRRQVAALLPGYPNGLIANWYRTGQGSISWHADAEPALGADPVVVSVSLGSARVLHLRPCGGRSAHKVPLGDGDLLVMGGHTQREFQHAILKTTRPTGLRVSLTFRQYEPCGPRLGAPGR